MLALGAPAVVISASVRENTSPTGNDPESPFPHYTRYVPPIIYRMGGHMTGVAAGMIDGAIDMGLDTKDMMADGFLIF